MLLVNVVVVVVMLGMCSLLVLDSGPAKGVLYAFALWRHRRRVSPAARTWRQQNHDGHSDSCTNHDDESFAFHSAL